jgi:transposase
VPNRRGSPSPSERIDAPNSSDSHYVLLYYPEIGSYWESAARVEWFAEFVETFPTPAAVRGLPKAEFVRVAWSVVGQKVNKRAKLEELCCQMSASVLLKEGHEIVE